MGEDTYYGDRNPCYKREKENITEKEKTVEEAAVLAVNLFDQANTGGVIEKMGSRGFSVSQAIDSLREVLNKDEQKTILNEEHIYQLRRDRSRLL